MVNLFSMLDRVSIPRQLATTAARVALAVSFLSAVADRFGLWGGPGESGVVWGDYAAFLAYTQTLLPLFPTPLAQVSGHIATGLEVLLAVLLLIGYQVRLAALSSALLLGCFASSMSLSVGPKAALDYSVWSAAAAALLLAFVSNGGQASTERGK